MTTQQEGLFESPSSAVLSPDGRYRYLLTRSWGAGAVAVFVMLNPSTADATLDDPTVRRCVGFARSWGCGGLQVVNLYAYRSPNPRDLWLTSDPVGPDNDAWIVETVAAADGPVVAAWGANARDDRVAAVRALEGMQRAQHLGLTSAGAPRHPLYLRADTRPAPFV